MKTIHRDIVGAFVFSSDGKILLGKNISGRTYESMWTIPGGGVESGESMSDAVIREIHEEVGVDISEIKLKKIKAKFGESEKTIGDERFLVKMTFSDYIVRMTQKAKDISLRSGDDFVDAVWFDVKSLNNLEIAPPAKQTLISMGLSLDSQE